MNSNMPGSQSNTQYIQHPQPQTRIPSSIIQDQSPSIRNGQAPPPVPVYTTQEVARHSAQMTAPRHTNTRPPEQHARDSLHFQYNRGTHLGPLHIPLSANTLPPIQPSPSSRSQHHHPDIPISPNASSPRQPQPPLLARRQSDPSQGSPIQVEKPQTTGSFDPLVLTATDAALGPVRSALDTVWNLALTNTRLALNKMYADFTHIATQERQKNTDLNAKVTSLMRELQVARHEVNVLKRDKQDLQNLVHTYESKFRVEKEQLEMERALKAGMMTGEGTTTNSRSGTGGGGRAVPHFDMDRVLGAVTEQVSKQMEKKMSAILSEIEEQKTLRVQAERKFETTLSHLNQTRRSSESSPSAEQFSPSPYMLAHTPSIQRPSHSSSSSSSSSSSARVARSPVLSKVISPADGPTSAGNSSGGDNTRRSASHHEGGDVHDDVTESARLRRSSTPRKFLTTGPLVASPTTTEMMVDISGFPPSSSSPLRLRRSLITDDVPMFRRISSSVDLGGQPPRKRSRATYEEGEARDRKDGENENEVLEEERRLNSRSGSFANEIKAEPRGSVGPPASSSSSTLHDRSTTQAMMAMQVDIRKEEEEEEGSSLRRSAPLFPPRGEVGPTFTPTAVVKPEPLGEREEDMLVERAEPRVVKPPPPTMHLPSFRVRAAPVFEPPSQGASSDSPSTTATAATNVVAAAGTAAAKKPPTTPTTTVQRSTKLGIGHIDLLYRTDNGVMTCRMCLTRSRDCLKANNSNNTTAGPIPNVITFKQEKASWDELISHCRNDHPKTCRDLETMGPTQIAEMKQRMMSGERGMSLRM